MFLSPANVPYTNLRAQWLALIRQRLRSQHTQHYCCSHACIRFAVLALKIFPGLETVSKCCQTTQPLKPIRIRQNTLVLPIQILLVSVMLFELL